MSGASQSYVGGVYRFTIIRCLTAHLQVLFYRLLFYFSFEPPKIFVSSVLYTHTHLSESKKKKRKNQRLYACIAAHTLSILRKQPTLLAKAVRQCVPCALVLFEFLLQICLTKWANNMIRCTRIYSPAAVIYTLRAFCVT